MNNTNISIFETFDATPVTIPLSRWIRSTMKGGKFAKQVQQYRQTGNDTLKKGLPLATVGAVCEGGRKLENVKQRTGWIALDIDAKDNPHLNDAEAVRDAISRIIYVAFAGLSVSGKGVWALVKVEDPNKQAKYFEQLQIDFRKRGIILDSTKGKNPNDARFYSFDPDAVINEDFEVYDRLPREKPKPRPTNYRNNYSGDDTRSKVEQLISKIHTDITAGYENWLSLGFAIESEFGESGRDYFHAISQYHPDYDRRECDRQYSQCVRHRGSGIGIGTFFHRCQEFGITLDRNHAPPKR
ncbi:MAG TPA: PriCT-2 domain-containing protein [Balneolaceae bacterium]|nr:PriCT-2 domain-containing protein [Balneolaceae bacterium]